MPPATIDDDFLSEEITIKLLLFLRNCSAKDKPANPKPTII